MENQKENTNNLLNILSELVSISSYAKIDSSHQIIKYLKEKLSGCEQLLELPDTNGNVHLLAGVNCELSNIDNAIILSGHIDTVPESVNHNSSVSIKDECAYGLGTSDMKAFIATIIANIEYLKVQEVPIILSITSDEETQFLGVKRIIQELKERNINNNLTIVGEPTNLDYYISSRGNSIYVSVIKGKSCHSGTPELGINAIDLTAEFIYEIKKISNEYANQASICITSVKGGKVPSNVVPDECSTCFGIRTSNQVVLDTIYNYLLDKHREICKQDKESVLFQVVGIPPFERKENAFLEKQATENGKNLVDARYSTEAGFFQNAYPEANIVIYGPGDPTCIHKPGENINIRNLYQYDNEFRGLIASYLEYCKQKNNNSFRLVNKEK